MANKPISDFVSAKRPLSDFASSTGEKKPLSSFSANIPETLKTNESSGINIGNLLASANSRFPGMTSGMVGAAPFVAPAMEMSPAVKQTAEGLKREEATFASAFRTGIKVFQKKDLTGQGKEILDSISGKNELELGDVFSEDLGMNEVAASTAGFIASMFLPSSVFGGKAAKEITAVKGIKQPTTFTTKLSGVKGDSAEMISKFLGIKRESVETALSEGPRKVLRREFDKELIPAQVERQINKGLKAAIKSSGEEVGRIKEALGLSGKKFSGARLKTTFDGLLEKYKMNDPEKFTLDSGLKADAEALAEMRGKLFQGKKAVTVDELMTMRDEIGDMVYSGFQRGGDKQIKKASTQGEAVLKEFRRAITKQIHDIAPDLQKADRKFMYMKAVQEKAAQQFDKIEAGQRFLERIDNETITLQDKRKLRQIARAATGTDELVNKVRYYLASKSFQDLVPKGLVGRLFGGTAIAGAAGGAIMGNPVFALTGGTIATLSSPRVLKEILKMGESGSVYAGKILDSVKTASARKAISQLTE